MSSTEQITALVFVSGEALAILYFRFGMKGLPRGASRFLALLLGIVATPLATQSVYGTLSARAATTLFETELEGTARIKAGAPAPVRVAEFTVEHPGVEHTLAVNPTDRRVYSRAFDANVDIRLEDGEGNMLIDDKAFFPAVKKRTLSRSQPATYYFDWNAREYAFVPKAARTYRLTIVPRTAGIGWIHVRVSDPHKKDGVRGEGY